MARHRWHQDEPVWAKFIDTPFLFGEAAHCFRDLGQSSESERFASESAAGARRQGRIRRGALSEAELCIADLTRANVEAAAARAVTVVDLAASANSTRVIDTVRDLQRRMRAHRSLPEVERFNARAAELLGLAA